MSVNSLYPNIDRLPVFTFRPSTKNITQFPGLVEQHRNERFKLLMVSQPTTLVQFLVIDYQKYLTLSHLGMGPDDMLTFVQSYLTTPTNVYSFLYELSMPMSTVFVHQLLLVAKDASLDLYNCRDEHALYMNVVHSTNVPLVRLLYKDGTFHLTHTSMESPFEENYVKDTMQDRFNIPPIVWSNSCRLKPIKRRLPDFDEDECDSTINYDSMLKRLKTVIGHTALQKIKPILENYIETSAPQAILADTYDSLLNQFEREQNLLHGIEDNCLANRAVRGSPGHQFWIPATSYPTRVEEQPLQVGPLRPTAPQAPRVVQTVTSPFTMTERSVVNQQVPMQTFQTTQESSTAPLLGSSTLTEPIQEQTPPIIVVPQPVVIAPQPVAPIPQPNVPATQPMAPIPQPPIPQPNVPQPPILPPQPATTLVVNLGTVPNGQPVEQIGPVVDARTVVNNSNPATADSNATKTMPTLAEPRASTTRPVTQPVDALAVAMSRQALAFGGDQEEDADDDDWAEETTSAGIEQMPAVESQNEQPDLPLQEQSAPVQNDQVPVVQDPIIPTPPPPPPPMPNLNGPPPPPPMPNLNGPPPPPPPMPTNGPPPPPMPTNTPPGPPPRANQNSTPAPSRDDMLAQIRAGKALKKIASPQATPATQQPSPPTASGNPFLDEIRASGGIAGLKKRNANKPPSTKPTSTRPTPNQPAFPTMMNPDLEQARLDSLDENGEPVTNWWLPHTQLDRSFGFLGAPRQDPSRVPRLLPKGVIELISNDELRARVQNMTKLQRRDAYSELLGRIPPEDLEYDDLDDPHYENDEWEMDE